jgi:hypothetical protein
VNCIRDRQGEFFLATGKRRNIVGDVSMEDESCTSNTHYCTNRDGLAIAGSQAVRSSTSVWTKAPHPTMHARSPVQSCGLLRRGITSHRISTWQGIKSAASEQILLNTHVRSVKGQAHEVEVASCLKAARSEGAGNTQCLVNSNQRFGSSPGLLA